MPTILDALTGLETLRDVLRVLAADDAVQAEFAPYGGLHIITGEEEDGVGKPHLVLAVESDEAATEWGHTARKCTVAAMVEASDFAGAILSASNPVTADTKLSRFLQTAVQNYDQFNDAGLWGIEATGPRETRVADDDGPRSVNVHRVTFYYDPVP